MGELRVVDTRRLGWDFIPPEFLPEGKDENYIRDAQSPRPVDYWQPLTSQQIAELESGDNTADDWANNDVITCQSQTNLHKGFWVKR